MDYKESWFNTHEAIKKSGRKMPRNTKSLMILVWYILFT